MFRIKLDKTNIILLAMAGLLAIWSLFVPVPPGGFFPLVLALLLIVYIRGVSSTYGNQTALLVSLLFLLVPLVLYTLFHMVTSATPASTAIVTSLPWTPIVFIALVVVGLLYALSKKAIPIVSSQIELPLLLRDARVHFGFLLERGYKLSHLDYVDHPNGGWHLQLDAPGDSLSIVLDQQRRPMLVLSRGKTDKPNQLLLEALIYHLTDRTVATAHPVFHLTPSRRQVFEHTAILLRTHIEAIEHYLLDHIELTKQELESIQSQYVASLHQDTKS